MITFEKCRKLFTPYYDNILEIDELCKAYVTLFNLLEERIQSIRNNILLKNGITDSYLEELERFWGIVPDTSLPKEYRLAQIKAKFSDRLPYDIVRLNSLVKSIIPDIDFTITENYNGQQVIINVDGTVSPSDTLLESVKMSCRNMAPAHIEILIKLIFTTWGEIKERYSTWGDVLNRGTWEDIKKDRL
jgi:hypothetical protein